MAFVFARAAGDYGDFFGDHEGGIKANAELADQLYIFFRITGEVL